MDCVSQICKRYARNMLEICFNMQKYYMQINAINMQSYAPNMHIKCKYIDCISQYARNMQKICLKYAQICR